MAPLTALRYSAFNLVSIVTTTGFATTDYNLWGGFALLVFFFLIFVGGCTGSTADGIKIFRFQVGALLLLAPIKRLAPPNTAFVRKFGSSALGAAVLSYVIGYLFTSVAVVARSSRAL